MSIRDLLETFDGMAVAAVSSPRVSDETLESVRASSFEAGYASGWDDAKAADDKARTRVQAEFERNVEAITFTFHEAVDRVRSELRTFLDSLLDEFLPAILPAALREHVRAELLSAAEAKIDVPLKIIVSENCADLISEIMDQEFVEGPEIITDNSLADNQVFVRIAENEKEINLTPVISELKFQLSAMTDMKEGVRDYGG